MKLLLEVESMSSELEMEARRCIEIQSHLSSCLYNWAAAHTFYEQEVICWSTTAAYYAMIHSVRTLFSLIEFDPTFENQQTKARMKKKLERHKQLCLFLSRVSLSNSDIELRNVCIDCFKRLFSNVDWDAFLRDLGNKLALMKEARENENYEHFVIAHHRREYHVVFGH